VASLVILFAHDTISFHFFFVSDPIATVLVMFFEKKMHSTHPKFTFCEDDTSNLLLAHFIPPKYQNLFASPLTFVFCSDLHVTLVLA
jgi:hypothetical protein